MKEGEENDFRDNIIYDGCRHRRTGSDIKFGVAVYKEKQQKKNRC